MQNVRKLCNLKKVLIWQIFYFLNKTIVKLFIIIRLLIILSKLILILKKKLC